MSSDHTIGFINEQGEFDVFAHIKKEPDEPSLIMLSLRSREETEAFFNAMEEAGFIERLDGRIIVTAKGKAYRLQAEQHAQETRDASE